MNLGLNLSKKPAVLYSTEQQMTELDLLSGDQLKEVTKCIYDSKIPGFGTLFQCLQDMVVWDNIHFEAVNNPYENLCERLAKISKGHFTPEKIKCNANSVNQMSSDSVEFSFFFNDKKYEKGLYQTASLRSMINNALEDQKVIGRFYEIVNPDRTSIFIFLNELQYEFMKKHADLLGFYIPKDAHELPDLTN